MHLSELKSRAKRLKMAVIGDFCLDVYWHADMRKSELSRETPHFPLPIVQERMSAGGAGNVVANLLALEPSSVQCIGVFGDDWRGFEYRKVLRNLGADINAIATDASRCTNAYIKPLRKGLADVVYEDPRLDFSNSEPICADTENALLNALDSLQCDALCVCDQLPFGCITPAIRDKICQLGQGGMTVVVDSRDRIGLYRDVIVKPNELEACRTVKVSTPESVEGLLPVAAALSQRTGRPAVVTAGEHGCVTANGNDTSHIPAIQLTGEIDICGAGDTFLSAFSIATAAGATLNAAASFACAASSVIVRKIHTTGTATWQELESVAASLP